MKKTFDCEQQLTISTIDMETEIIYDGTSVSVEKVMDALDRTAGVNNTPDYLVLDERRVNKGDTVVVGSDKKWHIKNKA